MSIRDLLKETYNNREWNYYSIPSLRELYIFDSGDECKRFVNAFWRGSLKESVVEKFNICNNRYQHVVFAFLLGLALYYRIDNFKVLIDNELNEYTRKFNIANKVEFSYIWFLIVLSHDFGYDEDDKERMLCASEFYDLIKSFPLSIAVPKLFSHELLEKYLKYRKFQEHGIYSGLKNYQKLCEIRKKMYDLKETTRNWENGIDGIYGVVSWIVACHNIWFLDKNNDTSKLVYEHYGLNDLLLNKGEYKIDVNRCPLFYLFCLVDSIDPIKVIKDTELLDKIDIEINTKEITINSSLKCGCKDIYYKNIRQLNQWLTKTKETRAGINISI